jgi:hypothetical protein
MKALTAEQANALLKIGGRGRRSSTPSPPTRYSAPDNVCAHLWQPDRTIVSGTGKEYQTKRCAACNIWLLCSEEELIVNLASDMGEWLG